jgi:methyl-accepting chemotaxis protein
MASSNLLSLSWKQKLTLIIIITLLGLAIVAGSAFMGFKQVNKSVIQQMDTSEYKQLSLTFSNNLFALEAAAKELTSENATQFTTQLNQLRKEVETIAEKAALLGVTEMRESSVRLSKVFSRYFELSEQWLANSQTLGFSLKDGQRAQLLTASEELNNRALSITRDNVNIILGAQSGYLNTTSVEDEQTVLLSISKLMAIVDDMGWRDNIMGQSIVGYATQFESVQKLINIERDLKKTMVPASRELRQVIENQNQFLDDIVTVQVLKQANDARTSAVKIMILSAIGVGLVILISLVRISRQLNIELLQMREFLKTLSDGNFSKKLALNNNENDEFTQLRKASNDMTSDVAAVITQVVSGNHALSLAKDELEKVVIKLSQSSDLIESQSHNSSEATQQISIAVNDVAKRSGEVRETSQQASELTQSGSNIINQSVNSIVNISELITETHHEALLLSESNDKMQGIVNIINSLAEQTNLLALNAAIESARAGEAGRGFAVVADEVRALAQKTVGATSGISDIIHTLSTQSSKMTELMDRGLILAASGQDNANNAINAITTIESAIESVSSEMDQVVVAVEEISYNTKDISNQIQQISKQTDANKQIRDSLEQHSMHIAQQVTELERLTNRFIL